MSDIRVPELGESIVEATILNWFKHVGDSIQVGEAVLELETDKVNVEVMSEDQGVLNAILKQAGETVTVGETVGTIGTGGSKRDGEEASETAQQADAAPGMPFRPTPSMRKQAREQGGQFAEKLPVSVGSAVSSVSTEVAALNGSVHRVVDDASSKPDRADEERQRMTRRRSTIAKRLVEAQHNAAMLTTFNEVDMSSVLELRGRRKNGFKDEHGVSLGFMSFFTKATVAALKRFPPLNAQIDGEDIILKHHFDIGVAVSTDGGLVVPVVREADRLTFAEIETEISRLAAKARSNTLGLEDLQGGTFTITNGGVFGSLFSTPILNSPQVGILGMHGIKERPIVVDGRVEIRPMMYIALSYDHRIVDGAEAVQFLGMVKNLIEDPETLLLES